VGANFSHSSTHRMRLPISCNFAGEVHKWKRSVTARGGTSPEHGPSVQALAAPFVPESCRTLERHTLIDRKVSVHEI
jgi:hypothetical protein